MASEVGGGEHAGGKGRGKRGSTLIDMTPMVDLGFLLLTFFILTATMDDPKSMAIAIPADKDPTEKEDDKVAQSKVMNILVTGHDRVYYYMGKGKGDLDVSDMELKGVNHGKGIRKAILENKERLKKSRFATAEDPDPMIALIKMAKDARYENMVDILDEMNLTRQTKYMLLDLDKVEAEIVDDYEKNEGIKESSVTESLKDEAPNAAAAN